MKKIIVAIAALMLALSANAQMYVGGSVSMNSDGDNEKTSFELLPEIGYRLNDKWTVGGVLGFTYCKDNGENIKYSIFEIAPYARYSVLSMGPVNFFVDGGVGFSFAKAKSTLATVSEYSLFEIGFKPGLAIPVSDNLSFVGHVGFLGYRDNDGLSSQDNGFCLNVGGNDVSFGIYYSF